MVVAQTNLGSGRERESALESEHPTLRHEETPMMHKLKHTKSSTDLQFHSNTVRSVGNSVEMGIGHNLQAHFS